jgi:CO/xanthine dehydrogenase FAD-binding subunit
MKPSAFAYFAPETLEEALDHLAELGDEASALAGGQSLLAMMNLRVAAPPMLVDVMRIQSLQTLERDAECVSIGAGIRMSRAARECGIPLLTRALGHVGHAAIRNAGTICGSVAHADPSAEVPGVLVALDGEVVLQSVHGTRTVAAGDFFTSFFTTARRPDELVTHVRVPHRDRRTSFQEVTPRMGGSIGEFATAAVAAAAEVDDAGRLQDVAIALVGVGERPMRAAAAEAQLNGAEASADLFTAAGEAAAGEAAPAADVHAGPAHRRRLVATLVGRALQEIAGDR